MTPDVDVIIVAHDSGQLLTEAVASAVAEVGEPHVVVLDAESGDGSIEAAAARFPGIRMIPVRNEGFSAGNNRGIEATSGEFVMLLNPDAILQPGTIALLVRTMRSTPDAGIVAPVVRNPDGSMQAGSYGRFPTLITRAALGLRRFGNRLMRRADAPRVPARLRPVDWVTGAAMLVRRDAITAAGPMDEAFFLYYEDIEWCHRMWDHGWRVLVEPAVSVTHHVGQSGASGTSTRVAEEYRRSFERYCELYNLHALRLAGRIGVAFRGIWGN